MGKLMEPPTFRRTGINPDARVGALLLHGLKGIPEEMSHIGMKLEAAGVKVSAPILPGHGLSYQEMLETGWQDWVDESQKEFDQLAKECDKIVVAGRSMGAILAMIIASKSEKATGLGLLSPTLKYDCDGAKRLSLFSPVIQTFPFLRQWLYSTPDPAKDPTQNSAKNLSYGRNDAHLQQLFNGQMELAGAGQEKGGDVSGLSATYCNWLRQLEHLVKYCRTAAPHVRCPALVLHSLKESLASEANAIESYRMLGSRDKRMVLLSGSDHMLALDLSKEDVANQILKLTIDASYYEHQSNFDGSKLLPPIFST
jgi:carboxylesterase